MIGALIFNLISLFFAWTTSFFKSHVGLKLSIFTLFIFLSIRYDYGNDYQNYLDIFHEINNYSSFSLTDLKIKGNEIGWVYINYLFDPFGFFAMQIFLAGFSCFILYRFLKKYLSPKYYWWAIFIYTFQPYHMLVQSSAMRQAVAISFFLIAIDFLVEKKPIYFFTAILIASLFHSTAYFLLPLFILSYVRIQLNFKNIFLIVFLFLAIILFPDKIFTQAETFVSFYFEEEYKGYINQKVKGVKAGYGFIINFLIYIILFYFTQNQKETWKAIVLNVVIFSFLILPLTFNIFLVDRLNFYFNPILMIAFPLAFENIKEKLYRSGYMALIAFFTIYQFFYFFYSETWTVKFFEYKTIFSAPTFF